MSVAHPLGHSDDADLSDVGGWRSKVAWVGVMVWATVAVACAWSLTVEQTGADAAIQCLPAPRSSQAIG